MLSGRWLRCVGVCRRRSKGCCRRIRRPVILYPGVHPGKVAKNIQSPYHRVSFLPRNLNAIGIDFPNI